MVQWLLTSLSAAGPWFELDPRQLQDKYPFLNAHGQQCPACPFLFVGKVLAANRKNVPNCAAGEEHKRSFNTADVTQLEHAAPCSCRSLYSQAHHCHSDLKQLLRSKKVETPGPRTSMRPPSGSTVTSVTILKRLQLKLFSGLQWIGLPPETLADRLLVKH
eukprot:516691-Pelagomonas_calceolata.AAC.2